MTVYGLEHVYHLLQGLGNIVEGRGDTVEEPEDGVGFGGMLSSGYDMAFVIMNTWLL